jgi:hypothetical protein
MVAGEGRSENGAPPPPPGPLANVSYLILLRTILAGDLAGRPDRTLLPRRGKRRGPIENLSSSDCPADKADRKTHEEFEMPR